MRGKWEPIETAPRDGTQILTYCDYDGSIEIDSWWERPISHFEEAGDGLYRKIEDEPFTSWSQNGHRASHWTPLPEPPCAQAHPPKGEEPANHPMENDR